MKINLFDENGINKSPLTGFSFASKQIEWIIENKKYDGITVFTDKHIVKNTVVNIDSKIKIAWLVEPRVVYQVAYKSVIQHMDKYDYILTYDQELLNKNNKKCLFVPGNGTWVPLDRHQIYNKSKRISSIVSKKNMFPGHKIRHKMCESIKNIDYYGSKFTWIKSKDIGLKDYMFSIAIENSAVQNYFTEKILDCFLCGTVPVYWGCTNIGKFFNKKGIVIFNTIDELEKITPALNKKLYNSMLPAIKDNFELAKKYAVQVDWIHDNIFSNINS